MQAVDMDQKMRDLVNNGAIILSHRFSKEELRVQARRMLQAIKYLRGKNLKMVRCSKFDLSHYPFALCVASTNNWKSLYLMDPIDLPKLKATKPPRTRLTVCDGKIGPDEGVLFSRGVDAWCILNENDPRAANKCYPHKFSQELTLDEMLLSAE